jgi:hypothetical protein
MKMYIDIIKIANKYDIKPPDEYINNLCRPCRYCIIVNDIISRNNILSKFKISDNTIIIPIYLSGIDKNKSELFSIEVIKKLNENIRIFFSINTKFAINSFLKDYTKEYIKYNEDDYKKKCNNKKDTINTSFELFNLLIRYDQCT